MLLTSKTQHYLLSSESPHSTQQRVSPRARPGPSPGSQVLPYLHLAVPQYHPAYKPGAFTSEVMGYLMEYSLARRKDKILPGMGLKNHDTKRNKLEEKCQEPYYFTQMWDIKLKATSKTNKQRNKNS